MEALKQGTDALFILLGAIMVLAMHAPDGQVKFPHPWPSQIPPGRTTRL